MTVFYIQVIDFEFIVVHVACECYWYSGSLILLMN